MRSASALSSGSSITHDSAAIRRMGCLTRYKTPQRITKASNRTKFRKIPPSSPGFACPCFMNWGPTLASSRNRSEEHTSELQSHLNLVCRLLLEKKKTIRQLYNDSIFEAYSYRESNRLTGTSGRDVSILSVLWP